MTYKKLTILLLLIIYLQQSNGLNHLVHRKNSFTFEQNKELHYSIKPTNNKRSITSKRS